MEFINFKVLKSKTKDYLYEIIRIVAKSIFFKNSDVVFVYIFYYSYFVYFDFFSPDVPISQLKDVILFKIKVATCK